MTLPVNSQLADSAAAKHYAQSDIASGEAAVTVGTTAGRDAQPELVFTQDRLGQYLSFYWRDAEHYGLNCHQVVHTWISDVFGPVATTPYLAQINQVLDSACPSQLIYPFRFADQIFLFDLTISPVLVPGQTPTMALVSGLLKTRHSPGEVTPAAFVETPTLKDAERYQRLLTLISWNIRRTLDLPTIWQQTAIGLGKAFDLARCLVCCYRSGSATTQVMADYSRESVASLVGDDLTLEHLPYLRQALTTLKPVLLDLPDQPSRLSGISTAEPQPKGANHAGIEVAESLESGSVDPVVLSPGSVLIVATSYRDRPNGLICLYQDGAADVWSDAEIELVRELADQVGTAIAQATLFSESQALTVELRRVNDSLVQKHRELEEAHQRAEEVSRLKSEFLANTSHELRTPLNGMIGFLKLVMDGMADDPEEQQEFIEEAYRSALHLLNIINDILDVAKIEAGKMQLDLNPVRLNELFNHVQDFTAAQAQQKNLTFETVLPPTHDEVIMFGNYQRLLQVMLNLVGNAIKFTNEGGVTVSAEVIRRRIEAHGKEFPGMVKVRVADTGIGVSLEKQDKLFQSFSQVDGSRTRQYGGTGLGLVISQKLVEAMGGVVNFYSMGEGLGSTVTFTVPLYQDPLMISTQPKDAIDLLI